MKLSKDCYKCLQRLVYQAAGLATNDKRTREKAVEQGLKVLRDNYSYDEVSIVVATKIHDVIKEVTGNSDPYRILKDKEMVIARELYSEVGYKYGDGFKDLVRLAVLGNALDFFRPFDAIKQDMRREVNFVIDDTEYFKEKLQDARTVLYLADNAGEVFFDLPLVKWMKQFASVTYVVKAAPVQNDITLDDIKNAGLEAEIQNIMTTDAIINISIINDGNDFSMIICNSSIVKIRI